MIDLNTAFASINTLLQQGGSLLWAIIIVAMIIFALFFERIFYMGISFPKQLKDCQTQWSNHLDSADINWHHQRIREALLAQGEVLLNRSQWLLKFCVVVCPLLGLTGTVTGMILVFDNLSFTGTGNPRLMSSGIFQATIPTMAGMLVAIIGMILQQIVIRMIKRRRHQMEQALVIAPTLSAKEGVL